jgi:peroxiredoxin
MKHKEDFVLAVCQMCKHQILDSAVAQYKETVVYVYPKNSPPICLCNECVKKYEKEYDNEQ